MHDHDAEAVFARPPEEWAEEDAELVKQLFLQRRPTVPSAVVGALWRYWTQVRPRELLFKDIDDNRALVLHAKAFGLPVSCEGAGISGGPLAALLTELDASSVPLAPAPLAWGPMAALAPQVYAALSSSLVRAWVTVDDQGPTEVLVVGEGLPEIRRRVLRAALEASLRMNGLADTDAADLVGDVVGVGIIRLSAGSASKRAAIDIPPVFDARQVATSLRSSPTVQGALRDFIGLLRKLARETNLVTVEEIRHRDVEAFDQAFRNLAERAASQPDTAFLRRPGLTRSETARDEMVTLLPCLRTARAGDFAEGSSVGLELSPDLLETESYQRLEQAHQQAMAHRLTIDAMLRRDRLVEEIERFRADLDAYTRTAPEERSIFYEPTVLLVERFEELLGITIKLAEPEEVDTARYYEVNMPQVIALRESWVEKLTELIDNLQTAINRPYAPARQIAAGRFLDTALRGVTPDESPTTARAFEQWRREIQPMLWFEWRRALASWGIEVADLFTPHTVLVTRYLPAVFEDDALLFTHPYTIVDRARSGVLATADRGVIVVRDATDHAEAVAAASPAPDRWDELVQLAGQRTVTEEQFSAAFLTALRASPGPIVRRLLQELRPAEPSPAETEMIDAELRKAERATSVSTGMDVARIAMQANAFLTARQSLEKVRGATRWEARACLLRAVVECLAAEIPYREVPDALSGQLPGLSAAAVTAVSEAESLDEDYTKEWLAALATLPEAELNRGIQRLFLGLPRARKTCSGREYAVLLFRRALAAVQLARELEDAAAELSDEQEAIDAVLVRVGRQLEDILVSPYTAGSAADGLGLLAVLTGREPPKYGRLTAR
jgi:hypothetical protein